MLESIEQRIKTAAEREEYAKQRIRQELAEKAEAGDWDGIREMLLMIADEAEASDSKPRATVEARNETGMSLLAIAAKHNHTLLAEQLLTYWRNLQKEEISLVEGEISRRAKVFKVSAVVFCWIYLILLYGCNRQIRIQEI
jgi:DNA invertase Pin-like site-specific DNA recombinase